MDFLQNPSPLNSSKLAADYLEFSKNKKIYDQIRYLDSSGQERVRVNFNKGNPSIVQQNKLLNKGKRYYFKDAYKLNTDEVFVSPFDLNIERGQIEQPIKPMIRFGMPVFDVNGEKQGIILLNYLGNQLLSQFRATAKELPGKVILLNRDGYSLSSDDSQQDWSFMYPQKNLIFILKITDQIGSI